MIFVLLHDYYDDENFEFSTEAIYASYDMNAIAQRKTEVEAEYSHTQDQFRIEQIPLC